MHSKSDKVKNGRYRKPESGAMDTELDAPAVRGSATPSTETPVAPSDAPSGLRPALKGAWALLWAWLKKTLNRMWQVRGGGFYGLGFVAFFLWAQGLSLWGDVTESDSMADFLTSQALEMVIRLLGETPANFIWALLWPLHVLSWDGRLGFLGLLAGFLAFERWGRSKGSE